MENSNQNQTQPDQAAQPASAVQPAQPQQGSTHVYASFGQRLIAAIIDGFIVFAVQFVLTLPFPKAASGIQSNTGAMVAQLVGTLFALIYYVYFIYKEGATPGKKMMKIRVIREDGQPITVVTAILREVVGKFVSGIVIFLGYLWVLWDKKKQAWHDMIAGTVVVKM